MTGGVAAGVVSIAGKLFALLLALITQLELRIDLGV